MDGIKPRLAASPVKSAPDTDFKAACGEFLKPRRRSANPKSGALLGGADPVWAIRGGVFWKSLASSSILYKTRARFMPDEILTLPEVAELLKVAEKTVYTMAQKSQLPAF